ncbi:MAG: metal ABC transporter permease [Planctomycetota bacterium]
MLVTLAALNLSWELDGWIILAAVLCAIACAIPGNFLVLRRMSMLGDAITHAVLPGIAVAFFVSQSRSSLPMFLGAAVVGILTAFFVDWIQRLGRVDEGASMGVVFTSLFALGLVMIVQAADHVELDPGCVLYGAIELTPLDMVIVQGRELPRAVLILGLLAIANTVFVGVFFKELLISSFDPSLATTSGISAAWMHYLLMVVVAVTAVACFESVGSVLVVAMFVVPPATAYMLTDRLSWMIGLSLLVAVLSGVLGHISAIAVPSWFGFQSTTTASMMAVCSGVFLFAAALFAPRHGIVIRAGRRYLLSLRILCDDLVALLYRLGEGTNEARIKMEGAQESLLCQRLPLVLAARLLVQRGDVSLSDGHLLLTSQGQQRAQNLIRSHRLWESYLQDQAGMGADRVHVPAERLEHFTDSRLRGELDRETNTATTDPHGRDIPAEVDARDR